MLTDKERDKVLKFAIGEYFCDVNDEVTGEKILDALLKHDLFWLRKKYDMHITAAFEDESPKELHESITCTADTLERLVNGILQAREESAKK